jgi:hypothetical protein
LPAIVRDGRALIVNFDAHVTFVWTGGSDPNRHVVRPMLHGVADEV